MAKNNKENKRGLGRGLDSLIPKIDDGKEEDSERSSLTLEDILSNSEEENINKVEKNSHGDEMKQRSIEIEKNLAKETEKQDEKASKKEDNVDKILKELDREKDPGNSDKKEIDEKVEKKLEEKLKKEKEKKEEESEKTVKNKEEVPHLNEYELNSIEEVKEIIEKNPRITLWSTKSSAVFRYLRKTRPEFSISKEASELIDQAVSEKYPEIWKLFEDL